MGTDLRIITVGAREVKRLVAAPHQGTAHLATAFLALRLRVATAPAATIRQDTHGEAIPFRRLVAKIA